MTEGGSRDELPAGAAPVRRMGIDEVLDTYPEREPLLLDSRRGGKSVAQKILERHYSPEPDSVRKARDVRFDEWVDKGAELPFNLTADHIIEYSGQDAELEPGPIGYVKSVDPVAGRVEVVGMPRWYESKHEVEALYADGYQVERFEDLFQPPRAEPVAQLDITDLMLDLWVRLLANIGLLAGVVRPECFGWPAGSRAVVRR